MKRLPRRDQSPRAGGRRGPRRGGDQPRRLGGEQAVAARYPILSDPTKAAARAYGVVGGLRFWSARWRFYIGRDGRILAIDKSVETSTAGRDIVARLASLGISSRAGD